MRLWQWQSWRKNISSSLFLKFVAISLFLILSIVIVSCGNNNNNPGNLGNPVVTVTVNLGEISGSSTPPFPDYTCGGWATNTSPPYNPSSPVNVYAKFTHTNSEGNPEGIAGANATAIVLWPDGSTSSLSAVTGSDGLAVFPVALKPIALNKIVLIQISFSKQGVPACTIPQAAYFTAILASPMASGTPNGSPTDTPVTRGTATPTVTPSDTPSPTKTPKGH